MIVILLIIALSLVSIAAITIVVAQIQPVKIVLLNGHAMN